MDSMGKMLVVAGVLLIVVGAAVWGLSGALPLGRLPGDIYVRRGNFSFYFPLTTSIVVSVVISLLWMLFRR